MSGFNNSPRLIVVLISDLLLRWNQSIDINLCGLSKKYDRLFIRQRLEDEISKKRMLWPDCDLPPHPEWSSASDGADTGEVFEITAKNLGNNKTAKAAQTTVNEIIELYIEMADSKDDLMSNIPASTCWLATMHGRD